MDRMENIRERVEALEQQTKAKEAMVKPASVKFISLLARLALLTSALILGAPLSGYTQHGNLPPDAPRALLLGFADSPIFEALQDHVRLASYDGSQDISDFDVIIVDGDAFPAQQLRDEALIHRALRAGLWVLGLDMKDDDKQHGLGYSLGAATPGTSPAY